MKREMTKLTVFAVALALALPAVMGAEQSDAFAVGSIVSSRSGGKRTHKAAAKKSSDSSDSSRSNSSRTTSRTNTTRTPTHRTSGGTTTRTTTTRRPAGTTTHGHTTHGRTTTRTRVNERPHYAPAPQHRHSTTTVSGGRRTTTTTTTTTTRTRSGRHYYDNGPVYYAPAPARRTTVNNNHYYYGNTQQPPPATVYEQDTYREESYQEESRSQAYIMGTVGLGGLAAPRIAEGGALPGVDFNLGLGGRSEWVALEMGFGMGGYRLDPDKSASDLLLLGTSLDVKLQPSIGFLEPYVMAGIGGQYLRDYVVDTSALGGSVRLGAGLDLRFDDLALTMRYTFSQHGWLEDDRGLYGDGALSAQSETIAVGLTLYF